MEGTQGPINWGMEPRNEWGREFGTFSTPLLVVCPSTFTLDADLQVHVWAKGTMETCTGHYFLCSAGDETRARQALYH
jgi:hypothetical protein